MSINITIQKRRVAPQRWACFATVVGEPIEAVSEIGEGDALLKLIQENPEKLGLNVTVLTSES